LTRETNGKVWSRYSDLAIDAQVERPRAPGKMTLAMGLSTPSPLDGPDMESGSSAEPAGFRADLAGPLDRLDRSVDAPIQAKGLALAAGSDAPTPTTVGGNPMPEVVQAKMERSFQTDFSAVRIHEGQHAAAAGALAYTQGTNIHFAPGQYAPHSSSGQELLGHELAHVVQQSSGRVQATRQMKGLAVNDNPALEHEADVMGARAARGEAADSGGAAATLSPGSHGPIQRKIQFAAPIEGEAPVTIGAVAKEMAGEAPAIFEEVLASKPRAIKEAPALTELDVGNPGVLEALLTVWDEGEPAVHTYTAAEYPKLLKHAFKFHFSKAHDWRSVGVAEYMTGDATGLALAPQVDENLTVKVLTGQQVKPPKPVAGPTFLTKGESGEKEFPGTFNGALATGQVVSSDTDGKDGYKGTSDRYSKHYNAHTPGQVKPWNKETYEATTAIGTAFEDPANQAIIREQLLPGDSDQDQETKQKIEEYKKAKLDPQINGNACVFLWGRTSGKNGGAHKELDSHPAMMIQLAQMIHREFPDRVLVVIGDEVITLPELAEAGIKNHVVYMGPFWKDPDYGQYLKDRNSQRYLTSLFDAENNAVSIGMRSGSLEGMALLGMKVIFLDDKGNNAAGRMESWAGNAADGRAAEMSGSEVELANYEDSNKGPMANYKRVATLLPQGSEIDARNEMLKAARDLIAKLEGVDNSGSPVSDEVGSKIGNGLFDAFFFGDYAETVVAGKMPDDPKRMKDFFKDFDKLVKTIASSGFMGKAASEGKTIPAAGKRPEKVVAPRDAEPGKTKFRTTDVKLFASIVALLGENNVLQPDELEQVAFLARHLSKES
jgi:Domain of unknown function (DUF4157)